MARAFTLLLLILFSVPSRRFAPPLEVSFWYWHTPFRLSPGETKELREIGVTRLFVRAGTFSHEYKLTVPQKWAAAGSPFKVALVYNFDSGLLRHFGDLDVAGAADAMARAINSSSKAALMAGVAVEGVQLDIDCPTRLLPKYASLVQAIRPLVDLPGPWKLSVTGLSSWLGTRGLKRLASKVDFLAPQFYESDLALDASQVRSIGDLSAIERGLPKAADLGKPVYAGIATYGRALLYDPKGRLAGIYRGLSPEDALRHPALEFCSLKPLGRTGIAADKAGYVGEDQLSFVANGPTEEARGYRLVYDLPSPELLARELEAVRRAAPDNCQGVILYRMPQDEDGMALLLPSVAAVLRGADPKPDVALQVSARPDPWRLVDSNGGKRSSEIRVVTENKGDGPTGIAPNGVQILVRWPEAGLIEAEPGDFDSVRPGTVDPASGRFRPCSPLEANAALLSRSRLQPGQRCESGLIEVEGNVRAEAFSAIRTPGGFGIQTSQASSTERHP